MPESDPSRDWADVDAQSDAEEFVELMEATSAFERAQTYKRRSYALLRPDSGDRLLDVGCGTGDDVVNLAPEVGPEGEVVGVDTSEEMLDSARENAREMAWTRFEVGEAEALDFDDDSFDGARADHVLQHLPEPDAAFGELVRVTRPGGRVAVSDADFETGVIDTPGDFGWSFLSLEQAPNRNPTIGRRLRRLAQETGLTDIAVNPFSTYVADFDFFENLTMLEDWLDAMRDEARASDQEIDQWYDGLREAGEADRFFFAISVFTVAGTVPEKEAS